MHAELVVPGLLGSEGRFPALELLLARGRRQSAPAQRLETWVEQAFGLDAMPAGALTLLGCGRNPGEASWARADPVHLQLMREHVIVVPGEALEISGDESGALCEALNAHFPGMNFTACDPRRWCAQVPALNDASALDAAGRKVEPPRAAGPLLNEVQMLLHGHPVNEAREARGEPPVNSLWLWGAGRAPSRAQGPWQSVCADEPLALGAARLAGARHRALPRSAADWLERLPADGRHLAVLDARRTPLLELEKQWFEPLLAALRGGRIGMLTVHIPDAAAALSFETIRADLRRFWRRAKPIESYA